MDPMDKPVRMWEFNFGGIRLSDKKTHWNWHAEYPGATRMAAQAALSVDYEITYIRRVREADVVIRRHVRDGRVCTLAVLFDQSTLARMLRYMMDVREISQSVLMAEVKRVRVAAGEADSRLHGGPNYSATFYRFEGSRFEGRHDDKSEALMERQEVQKRDAKGRPVTRPDHSFTYNGATGNYTRKIIPGKRIPVYTVDNLVRWVGPTMEAWVESMTSAELTEAGDFLERHLTSLDDSEADEAARTTRWIAAIDKESRRNERLDGTISDLLVSVAFGRTRHKVRSLREAAEVCRAYIESHGIEVSKWSGGNVYDYRDRLVAKISYTGRAWKPGAFPQVEIPLAPATPATPKGT